MTPLIALNPTFDSTDTTLANGIIGKRDSLIVTLPLTLILKDVTTRTWDATGIVEIIAMTTTDSTHAPTGADEIKLAVEIVATIGAFDPRITYGKDVSGE